MRTLSLSPCSLWSSPSVPLGTGLCLVLNRVELETALIDILICNRCTGKARGGLHGTLCKVQLPRCQLLLKRFRHMHAANGTYGLGASTAVTGSE